MRAKVRAAQSAVGEAVGEAVGTAVGKAVAGLAVNEIPGVGVAIAAGPGAHAARSTASVARRQAQLA